MCSLTWDLLNSRLCFYVLSVKLYLHNLGIIDSKFHEWLEIQKGQGSVQGLRANNRLSRSNLHELLLGEAAQNKLAGGWTYWSNRILPQACSPRLFIYLFVYLIPPSLSQDRVSLLYPDHTCVCKEPLDPASWVLGLQICQAGLWPFQYSFSWVWFLGHILYWIIMQAKQLENA